MKKVIIGSDHGGYKLKEELKKFLTDSGYEVVDKGTNSAESTDYPIYGEKVAKEVSTSGNKGILICGTGLGMCMTANKAKGIRAAVCYDEYTAEMARKHNDANILCLGERTTDADKAKTIAKKFLETEFSDEERHKRRINEITEFENAN